MSARTLPPNPSLEQLKKQAKALLKAHRAGQAEAVSRLRASIPQLASASNAEIRRDNFSLHDAQTVIAREYGFAHWQALEAHIDSRSSSDSETVVDFLEAVRERDVEALKTALDAEPDLVHLRFDYGLMQLQGEPFRAAVRNGEFDGDELMTALHVMVLTRLGRENSANDEERARMHRVLELLLERGADINAKGRIEGYHYAISMACWEGHISTIKLLLERGADITGEAGHEALFAHGRLETIDLLAQYGAEIPPRAWLFAREKDRLLQMIDSDPSLLHAADDQGYTLLTSAFAAWQPDAEIINALVERGATVDVFAAAGLNDIARLETLYQSDAERLNGLSPLWFAAKGNALEATKLLCSKGAQLEEEPIREAALHDRTALVKVLLQHGGEITAYVMCSAAWRNTDPELIRLLLEHGGNPDELGPDNFGPQFGPIHWLSRTGQEAGVKLLLDAGADPNLRSRDEIERTPLHSATRYPAIIKMLLEAGADPDIANANRETPLDKARHAGVEASVRALGG